MPTDTETGSPGTPGTNGVTNGQAGTAGQTGGNILAQEVNQDANNQADATGGVGGKGGNGAAGTSKGGAAGAGGNGGDASANTSGFTTQNILLDQESFATGGIGGAAGTPGAPNGAGANGGKGGHAVSVSTATGQGEAQAFAVAEGGVGGTGTGVGHSGGAGGAEMSSDAAAAAYAGTDAFANIRLSGGAGGAGLNGANGGVGGSATLVATPGHTPVKGSAGQSLSFSLIQYGGTGGASAGGLSGAGGAASSNVTFDDTIGQPANSLGVASFGGAGGTGSTGAGRNSAGGRGGIATATAKVTDPAAFVYITATGGNGGAATTSAIGGAGAAGTASGIVTTSAENAILSVSATGGNGGAASFNGNGGAAAVGKATMSGSDIATGAMVGQYDSSWSAIAKGGTGGSGDGTGHAGAAGAKATATARGISSAASKVSVSASATGGDGGAGGDGAAAGAGAAEALSNAVSGYTNGGTLTLRQTAAGGNSGYSTEGRGAAGGAASSSLTFNDLANATKSAALDVIVESDGGLAGGSELAATGGAGGTATATSNITGVARVDSVTTARGGEGGYGLTRGTTGAAKASGTATGVTGSFEAIAFQSVPNFQPLFDFEADAKGVVDGQVGAPSKGTAVATAVYGAAALPFNKTSQAVAQVAGAPIASNLVSVFNANTQIRHAFAATSPSFFATGELGGGYDSKGTGTETQVESVSLTINPQNLHFFQDLVLGLYNGTSTGAGVDSVTLDVTMTSGGTTDLLPGGVPVTISGANAAAYFKDHPIDLGPLTPNGGFLFTINVSLTETISKPGAGFYADFILGDPPPLASASVPSQASVPPAQVANLASALFDGFFGSAAIGDTHSAPRPPVVADLGLAVPHAHG